MRRFNAAAVTLSAVAAAGLALGASIPTTMAAASAQERVATATQDASIRQGAKLAALGNCAACHTAPGGTPFAGGRALNTPFGKLYSTNITPDPETGIGRWSLADFTRAMREGVARDGHLLYPAFPYPHFKRMSDEDIASVYRFVMSRKAQHARAPKNELAFPFNIRPLLAGWNALFAHRDVDRSEIGTDALLKRGKYLVDGVGHCGACHTPMNALGAEKRGHAFGGGVIEGWDAPALTTLLQRPKPWTIDQLETYLRTGLANEHGAAGGPMRPVTDSLRSASADDLHAMAAYVMSLQGNGRQGATRAGPASVSDAVSGSGQSADHARLQTGATLFATACAACHDRAAPMSTRGDYPSLSLGTAVNASSPRNTIRPILNGIAGEEGMSGPYMPAFASMLTDGQVADVAAYLRSQFSPQAPWTISERDVAKLRKETTEP